MSEETEKDFSVSKEKFVRECEHNGHNITSADVDNIIGEHFSMDSLSKNGNKLKGFMDKHPGFFENVNMQVVKDVSRSSSVLDAKTQKLKLLVDNLFAEEQKREDIVQKQERIKNTRSEIMPGLNVVRCYMALEAKLYKEHGDKMFTDKNLCISNEIYVANSLFSKGFKAEKIVKTMKEHSVLENADVLVSKVEKQRAAELGVVNINKDDRSLSSKFKESLGLDLL